MKNLTVIILAISLLMACKQSPKSNESASSTPSVASSPRNDEAKNADLVQSGGVQLVNIETPKGKFRVWTKKFGDNPRIKILLLHGGPASSKSAVVC